jgi:hypothetical protein
MPTIAFLLARFSEPSSYAGLGALFALVGLNFSDALLGQIAQVLAAVCGLLALVLKERGLIGIVVLAVLIGAGVGACTGVPAEPTIPASAQSACAVVSWGVPIVQAMAGKLNPNDQAILAEAAEAVGACAAGNAPATIVDIAAALTAIIYPPAA